MELGTAITAGIMMLICAIPFILIYRSRKKKEKKLLSLISQVAEKSNSTISTFETWQNSIIGLDDQKNLLFYGRMNNNEVNIQREIDLNKIKNCVLNTNYRIVSSNETNQKFIDKIELCLGLDDSKKSTYKLTFFDSDDNFQLSGEVQLSQKWERLISNQLIK